MAIKCWLLFVRWTSQRKLVIILVNINLRAYFISGIILNIFICVCACAQVCLTLCDPMDCSPPDSSVHGILQARILEWVTVLFSKGSSQPRDRTLVSCIAGGFSTIWATREAYLMVLFWGLKWDAAREVLRVSPGSEQAHSVDGGVVLLWRALPGPAWSGCGRE